METVLISACLLGRTCRYDGKRRPLAGEILEKLREQYLLIPICPEVYGGLTTPRPPAERQGDRVVTARGADVTAAYAQGAEQALFLAREFGCKLAILKENSPSCGAGTIYDGSFSRRLIPGNGVTAALLLENGLRVVGESQLQEGL